MVKGNIKKLKHIKHKKTSYNLEKIVDTTEKAADAALNTGSLAESIVGATAASGGKLIKKYKKKTKIHSKKNKKRIMTKKHKKYF
jgi:hypothetical protein